MTLRHLKIFITVVDCGSMTAASEALFIAQPTVSQAVSELEDYYGVKLFDRLSRRLYITEIGKYLLSYARHIIALFDEMEQAMKNPDKSGILKIGASVTVGAYLLPQLVHEFANTYPSLQIQAVIKNTKDIESLITKNAIDFGVVEGIVHTPDIVSTAFMDDELVLVCGRSHPLHKAKSISLFDLSKFDFIVREQGSGTRELFESVMAANDMKWRLAWECNGSDGIKSAAINGIGVAVISKRLVEDEVKAEALCIIKVDDLDYKRKFSIIYHKNKYLTEAMKAFFDLCYTFSKKDTGNCST
ncbi:MAG: LysR family transcriptional regulator [Candidatus Humimicrobiaceae bacterium]